LQQRIALLEQDNQRLLRGHDSQGQHQPSTLGEQQQQSDASAALQATTDGGGGTTSRVSGTQSRMQELQQQLQAAHLQVTPLNARTHAQQLPACAQLHP
jgi:hypothetical protein